MNAGNSNPAITPARPSFRLVTICDDRTAHDGTLDRMLDSLETQGAEARVWLRCHGVDPRRVAALKLHPRIACITAVRDVQPLCMARNAILKLALADASDHEIIGFPDDDCWYAPGTLAAVAEAFAMTPGSTFLLGAIADPPSIEGIFDDMIDADVPICIDKAKSGGLFMRLDAFHRLQENDGYLFDQRFGLGALAGAAEEPDIALRMVRLGLRGVHLPHLRVGHPHKPHRPAQYWRGNLALLAKHSGGRRRDAYLVKRLALRALRGLRYILTGALSAGAYLSALWLMTRALGWDSPGSHASGNLDP